MAVIEEAIHATAANMGKRLVVRCIMVKLIGRPVGVQVGPTMRNENDEDIHQRHQG